MHHTLSVVLAVLGVLAFFGLMVALAPTSEEEEQSMDWHRRNGQFRVKYSDGRFSQPMSKKVAENYASMFDGVVVPKNVVQD